MRNLTYRVKTSNIQTTLVLLKRKKEEEEGEVGLLGRSKWNLKNTLKTILREFNQNHLNVQHNNSKHSKREYQHSILTKVHHIHIIH